MHQPIFHIKPGTMAICVAPEDSGWTFCPNLAAAALFTVLYGLTFLLHLYLSFRTRKVTTAS